MVRRDQNGEIGEERSERGDLRGSIINFPGCHVVAPSDMMDNRVGAIKERLRNAGLGGKAGVNFDDFDSRLKCNIHCRLLCSATVLNLPQVSMALSGNGTNYTNHLYLITVVLFVSPFQEMPPNLPLPLETGAVISSPLVGVAWRCVQW